VQYTYGPASVSILDENGNGTTQTHESFGNPEETRLSGLTDADGKSWHYSSNALDKLTKVIAPDGVERSWVYDPVRGLLTSETHPESGTTTYTLYDEAGNLREKKDANNKGFSYEYDGNDRLNRIIAGDRVTTIEYEPGSDNRHRTQVGPLVSVLTYDGAGRLHVRDETIDGVRFLTQFDYDANDNLSVVTYADGRRIGYAYDAENRITRVFDVPSGTNIASAFTYHPSGAVMSYTTANGISHQTVYDGKRTGRGRSTRVLCT